ncbi:unnamed protein product, partial [Linum tenue]
MKMPVSSIAPAAGTELGNPNDCGGRRRRREELRWAVRSQVELGPEAAQCFDLGVRRCRRWENDEHSRLPER